MLERDQIKFIKKVNEDKLSIKDVANIKTIAIIGGIVLLFIKGANTIIGAKTIIPKCIKKAHRNHNNAHALFLCKYELSDKIKKLNANHHRM